MAHWAHRALYLASAVAFPALQSTQNGSALQLTQHRMHALQALLPAPVLTLTVPPVASVAPVLGSISNLPAGLHYACLYVESDGAAAVVTGPKPLAIPASAVAVDGLTGAFSFPAWASDPLYDPMSAAFWGVVTSADCPAALSAPALPASLATTATAIARVARASGARITVTSFAPLPLGAGAGATAIAGVVTGLPLGAVALQALLYFGADAQAFTCAGPGLPLAQAAGSAPFAFPLAPALLASPVLTVVILPAALDVAAAGVCGQGLPGAPFPAGVLGAVLASASLDRTSALPPALVAEILRPTTPTASASASPATGSAPGGPAAGSEGSPAAAEPLPLPLPPPGEVAEAGAASATGSDSSSASPSASPTGTDSPSASASGSATASISARGAPFLIQEQSGCAPLAGRAAAYMGLAILLLALVF